MASLLVDAPWSVWRLVKTSWMQRNHALLRNWAGKCVKRENRWCYKYVCLTSQYDEPTRELCTSAAASWCRFRYIMLLNFLHWRWKKLLKLLVLAAGNIRRNGLHHRLSQFTIFWKKSDQSMAKLSTTACLGRDGIKFFIWGPRLIKLHGTCRPN